jgi:ribosomal-protein-alanine N-acetyltransferase
MDTPSLQLRPFSSEDLTAVVRLAGDVEVARTCMLVPHPYTEADGRFFLEEVCTNPTSLTLAITRRDDGRLIGCVSLDGLPGGAAAVTTGKEAAEPQQEEDGGEQSWPSVGYWVGREYWGQGIATEAATAIIDHGFDALGIGGVRGAHFVENPASGSVMRKCGLVPHGQPLPTMTCAARGGEALPVVRLQLQRTAWELLARRRQRLRHYQRGGGISTTVGGGGGRPQLVPELRRLRQLKGWVGHPGTEETAVITMPSHHRSAASLDSSSHGDGGGGAAPPRYARTHGRWCPTCGSPGRGGVGLCLKGWCCWTQRGVNRCWQRRKVPLRLRRCGRTSAVSPALLAVACARLLSQPVRCCCHGRRRRRRRRHGTTAAPIPTPRTICSPCCPGT